MTAAWWAWFCIAILAAVEAANLSTPIAGAAYRVGVTNVDADFGPTFATYLTATVGAEYGIRFEVVPVARADMFDAVQRASVDFIFTDPGSFACVEHAHGAAAIATLRALRQSHALNEFGGVIFGRADRRDVQSVTDLKDRIVAATSLAGPCSPCSAEHC